MVLIGIVGIKRSGKDTMADYIINNTDKQFIKYSFADPIKELCRMLFGFNQEQLYGDQKEEVDENWGVTPRKVFQVIGTDLFRDTLPEKCKELSYLKNTFWIKQFEIWYEKNREKNIIISDIRFQNELDVIKKMGGIIIYVIKKSSVTDSHISEQMKVNTDDCDIVIGNDGTLEEYYKKIDNLITKID